MRSVLLILLFIPLLGNAQKIKGKYSTYFVPTGSTIEFFKNGEFQYANHYCISDPYYAKGVYRIEKDTIYLDYYSRRRDTALKDLYFRTGCFKEDSAFLPEGTFQFLVQNRTVLDWDSTAVDFELNSNNSPDTVFTLTYGMIFKKLFEIDEEHYYGYSGIVRIGDKKVIIDCHYPNNSLMVNVMSDANAADPFYPTKFVISGKKIYAEKIDGMEFFPD